MKLRFCLPILVLLLAGCGLNVTQGSGNVITGSREVSGFNAVDFSGVGELTLTQGDKEELTIEAEDNLIPHIKTEVRGETLYIGFDEKWSDFVQPTKPIKFNLTLKDLTTLTISGAGNAQAESLETGQLTVNLSGTGNFMVEDLQAESLKLNLSGAGSLDLAGKLTKQEIKLSGAGSYNAENLNSEEATVEISGVGSATVWARKNLDLHLSGAGSISYYGTPTITQNISGVGSINSLGEK